MKNKMVFIQRAGFILLIFSALGMISYKNIPPPEKNLSANTNDGIVVMELFTRQGCSSCPPADALLAEYAMQHNAHIIPLSFHVDYWNRLGWTDPFSSSVYSERQKWYSQHLPKGSVYTPQLIVNGKSEAIGSNRSIIKTMVQKELSGKEEENILVDNISIGKNAASFHYAIHNAGKNESLNIALVQKQATTHIKAGENEGVTITNHNIVRSFNTQSLNGEGNVQVALPSSFNAVEYALVLFTQNKNDLVIHSALMKQL